MPDPFITLSEGSGGKEMAELISSFKLSNRGKWEHCHDDAATYDLGDGRHLVFTTDSFTITPLFFPGGDIGHVAACGTINDLCVMGAEPLGLSVGLVIEEGFSRDELQRIIRSIDAVSQMTGIPIVTGDTKVMERGKIDKIIINVSGVGIAKNVVGGVVQPGDKVILSGGLGEHAVALLSKRFDFSTDIVTDSKPLLEEMRAVRGLITWARDPTRGGIAASLNEFCERTRLGVRLDEESIPAKPQVRKVVEMLGIKLYELACEGRLVCIASPTHAKEAEAKLKLFNPDACIIGEVVKEPRVVLKTFLGSYILPYPTGNIVPRIC